MIQPRLRLLSILLAGALAACDRGSVTCESPNATCGGRCIPVQSDPANCGGCGITCEADQSCVEGRCECATGSTFCAGTCVDVRTDARHCGGCGQPCGANSVCESGECVSSCSAGTTLCGSSCVDLATDRINCGECGERCAQGQSCLAGTCGAAVLAACFNTGELVALDEALVPAASSALVGAGPQALARGADRVLVADTIDNALYRFDPTALPLAKEAGSDLLGHAANQVLVRGQRAFVVNSNDNTIQILDLSKAAPAAALPENGRTVDEIPTTPPGATSASNTSPSFVAFAADRLYVTLVGTCGDAGALGDVAGNRLLEIDVSEIPGKVTRELVFRAEDFKKDEAAANSPRPSGLAARGSLLYVAIGNLNLNCVGSAGPGYLAVVDTAAETLSARTIELPAACRNPAAVLTTEDRIYVTCPGSYGWGATADEALVVLDAVSEQVLQTTQFPRCAGFEDGPQACRTAVPGRMTQHGDRLLIADSNAGRLLVTDLDGKIPSGLEQGVHICAPICYGEDNTSCYQFTSDVLSLR
jgi:hypothetical protein